MTPVADDKDIKLVSTLKRETAYIDSRMIETVIRNLVNNAIKFTDQGGSIVIAAKDLENELEVSVTDSGVGMPKEKAEKLFSLSESSSTDGTKGEKGTGLGLLLCRELVERNGGEMHVTSEPGKGSTFAFTVPKNTPKN